MKKYNVFDDNYDVLYDDGFDITDEGTFSVKLAALNKGTFFVKKNISDPKESQVWVKSDYIRSEKKYECYRFDDINNVCYIPGSKTVFIGFTF